MHQITKTYQGGTVILGYNIERKDP